FDTMAWIMQQPWSNGRVGTMGLSYAAHTQMALACLNPPGHCVEAVGPFGQVIGELALGTVAATAILEPHGKAMGDEMARDFRARHALW
ncbi:CocE/NonD family hydrolase, partial [Xylella fastidiosa]|uniref:CocE/NonD family hydrolase n=1 Tax=Xylella fastidiosa TaxID=2371 RepID=UPI0019310406